jgi:hypothetical protein
MADRFNILLNKAVRTYEAAFVSVLPVVVPLQKLAELYTLILLNVYY